MGTLNKEQASAVLTARAGLWSLREGAAAPDGTFDSGSSLGKSSPGACQGWKTGCARPQSSHLQNTSSRADCGGTRRHGVIRGLRGAGEGRACLEHTAWT